jgi:hypothetical protein
VEEVKIRSAQNEPGNHHASTEVARLERVDLIELRLALLDQCCGSHGFLDRVKIRRLQVHCSVWARYAMEMPPNEHSAGQTVVEIRAASGDFE